MATSDEISAAVRDVKLALLEQIKDAASGTTNGQTLERLAYAYALTVGSSPGKLPGGPTHIETSK
jgi:hypothetical protein